MGGILNKTKGVFCSFFRENNEENIDVIDGIPQSINKRKIETQANEAVPDTTKSGSTPRDCSKPMHTTNKQTIEKQTPDTPVEIISKASNTQEEYPHVDDGDSTEVTTSKNGRLPHIKKFWNFLSASGKSTTTIYEYRYDHKWWIKKSPKP